MSTWIALRRSVCVGLLTVRSAIVNRLDIRHSRGHRAQLTGSNLGTSQVQLSHARRGRAGIGGTDQQGAVIV